MKNSFHLFCLSALIIGSCQIKSKKSDLVSQLERVAKISTTEMIVEKVVYHKDAGGLLARILGEDAYFLAHTEAHIKIGIDLTKIDPEEDIIIRGNTISIKLPAPEITNFSYPAEKFEVNETITNTSKAFMNKAKIAEIESYYRNAQSEIMKTLPKTGIFETAREKTKSVFTRMMHNLGYTVVQVEFKDQSNPIL